jgi:hypothetical protein
MPFTGLTTQNMDVKRHALWCAVSSVDEMGLFILRHIGEIDDHHCLNFLFIIKNR